MGTSRRIPVMLRWLIRADMPAVLAIEQDSFEYPWCEEDFRKRLCRSNTIGMAACFGDDMLVGFAIYELHKHRLHLLSMAVDPRYRRRGVGSATVQKLACKLEYDRRRRITLEVRETNLAAQLFFRSCGFVATSIVREYWSETNEDAYLMEYCHPIGCRD
jgi:[ribosomal protein S18]-alanine N-acetyltransferase